jgi:hypothetical protein
MEKMLRVFSPLYEACGLKISGPPALSDCNVMITGIDVGLIASGCARWLTGVGLTATFAVGLALVRVARRGGAFFAAFFLITLVFLTVFLRLAVLVTVVFLRFALALVFVAMAASLTLTPFGKSSSDRCRIRR